MNTGIARKEEKKKQSQGDIKKMIERMRDQDSQMVSVIFRNRENPSNSYQSGVLKFSFGPMYPGEETEYYELKDGERYKLPRGVVKHLNNNCYYREYMHLSGEHGEQGIRAGYNDGTLKANSMQASRKVHRFECVPLDFMEEDDLEMAKGPGLIEMTVSP